MTKATKPKLITREMTIDGAVNDAFSEIEMLAEEMRESFDNTPESLQQGGVGEMRGEAANNLENISAPDVPSSLAEIVVKWTEPAPSRRRSSRSSRRDDACESLRAVLEVLDEIINDETRPQELRDDAESLHSDLENAIDEADAVYFPGMYG